MSSVTVRATFAVGPYQRYAARLREIGRRAGRRLYISAGQEQFIVSEFRRSYPGSDVAARWMGRAASTCPLDLWIYQEIAHETRAEVIVALATSSAHCLTDLCRMTSRGEVLSIDPGTDVTALDLLGVAHAATDGRTSVTVIVGSTAGDDQLAEVLDAYSTLVTVDGYLIVEDTQGAVASPRGISRSQTVDAFLDRNSSFVVDHSREKFYFTFNPGGFLRRQRPLRAEIASGFIHQTAS
ncbi:MAG: hypothetical protein QOF20_1064 [Acidimicrobiaceae bacterium]|nr:hypothetical protein [Acidimicrobiaceae bacterium]